MTTLLKWLVLVPVAVLAILLAIANRAPVPVVFDPFLSQSASLTVQAPLFVVVFAALIAGIVIGGAAAWVRQGRHRKASRDAEAKAARERVEADRLRAQINAFASLPAPDRRAA